MCIGIYTYSFMHKYAYTRSMHDYNVFVAEVQVQICNFTCIIHKPSYKFVNTQFIIMNLIGVGFTLT